MKNQTQHINTLLELLGLEYEGTTLFRHVGNYIYQLAQRNIPEDLHPHQHCCEKFKSHINTGKMQ